MNQVFGSNSAVVLGKVVVAPRWPVYTPDSFDVLLLVALRIDGTVCDEFLEAVGVVAVPADVSLLSCPSHGWKNYERFE